MRMGSSGKTAILPLFLALFFFSNHPFLSRAILDPTDFLALQWIRKSMSDRPGSTFFSSSWDFTSDPCSFSGVICNHDRVFSLTLGDPTAGSPGLQGFLHPAVGNLSFLTHFSILPGHVYGSLPDTLSQCSNLRSLAISNNLLMGPIPTSFSQLQRLQRLDLSSNRLTGPVPALTSPHLTDLILSHNHLSGRVPPFVSALIERMDLSRNDLCGFISPSSFPPTVRHLSLSSNRLTGRVDRVLVRLGRLEYLDLSSNQFTGMIPGSLFSCPIESLLLQRNRFSGPIQPSGKVVIRTVDLSHNKLSGRISPLLATVENLYLNDNVFAGQVPASFVDGLMGEGIRVLYLQRNYLTGIEIDPTAAIPLRTSLCLMYNCMVVPDVGSTCPVKAGKRAMRPPDQCRRMRGYAGSHRP